MRDHKRTKKDAHGPKRNREKTVLKVLVTRKMARGEAEIRELFKWMLHSETKPTQSHSRFGLVEKHEKKGQTGKIKTDKGTLLTGPTDVNEKTSSAVRSSLTT